MLVKFHSSTSGEIIMFAETARQTLGVLGREPLARGVITREQMADSIATVEAALALARAERAPEDIDERPLSVSMAQRLVPFLELLQRTRADEGYVMWEAPGDFGPN